MSYPGSERSIGTVLNSYPLPLFAGLWTFFRAPFIAADQAPPGAAVLAGIAFDHSCTGRIGSRFGPRAIRENSIYYGYHLEISKGHLIDLGTGHQVTAPARPLIFDIGDSPVFPADLDATSKAVRDFACAVALRETFPVYVGGDEYVSLFCASGFGRALLELGQSEMGYLHVSGTLPLADRHPVWGRGWDGATVRRILDENVVRPSEMALVGANGVQRRDAVDYANSTGVGVYGLADIRRRGVLAVAHDAVARTSRDGRLPVFLAIDVSVVDGAFAPGTAIPRLDGLDNHDFLLLVDALTEGPIAALAITGVNPTIEATWTTQRLAALAMLRVIASRVLARQA